MNKVMIRDFNEEVILRRYNDICVIKDARYPMKFKRLPANELQRLEKEFVEFLVSNGVTADDWVKLKTTSPEKSEGLIDVFSDIVYQRAMENIEYLEHRTTHDLKVFHCEREEITLLGIEVKKHVEIDLRTGDGLKALENVVANNADDVALFTASKKYKPSREEEVFRMMNAGAVKTTKEWFEMLKNLYHMAKTKV